MTFKSDIYGIRLNKSSFYVRAKKRNCAAADLNLDMTLHDKYLLEKQPVNTYASWKAYTEHRSAVICSTVVNNLPSASCSLLAIKSDVEGCFPHSSKSQRAVSDGVSNPFQAQHCVVRSAHFCCIHVVGQRLKAQCRKRENLAGCFLDVPRPLHCLTLGCLWCTSIHY